MKVMGLVVAWWVGLVVAVHARPMDLPPAQPTAEQLPTELVDVGIDERPGAVVPPDIQLVRQDGTRITWGRYFQDGKPVVLVLAYYSCPMLCTVVLNGLKDGLGELAWNVGEQFRVVTVSFDPRDTPQLAAAKRVNYIDSYGRAVPDMGWDFLTGDEANVKRLADAVGFRYRWDAAGNQYAHAAGAFVLTPDGRLSRTLYGVIFPERHLRLALTEASEGRLGSAFDRALLFCFHYDPTSRSYVLAATRLMRVGGVVTMVLLSFLLFRLWRRERRGPLVHAERTT